MLYFIDASIRVALFLLFLPPSCVFLDCAVGNGLISSVENDSVVVITIQEDGVYASALDEVLYLDGMG